MSGRRCPPPPALTAWLDARRPLPAHVAYLERRYGGEPYRLALALLAADLEAASQVDMTARLLDEAPHQARVTVESIQEVLDMIAGAIPREVAADYLRTVRIQTATFGLHAARLDIREDSGASPPRSAACSTRSASTRASRSATTPSAPRCSCASVGEAARRGRPGRGRGTTEASAEAWRLFRLLARMRSLYRPESLGPFIISMTRGAADMLSVLLLGRWAGCARRRTSCRSSRRSTTSTRPRGSCPSCSRSTRTARTWVSAAASRW
jgi:phosphoenolpyruvate carboxylase